MPGRGSDQAHGGNNQPLQRVIALTTGAVTTGTHSVGAIPRNCRIHKIRFYGNAAPTATSLTAEVFIRTAAGAAGVTVQASATDIDFASQAAARAGVDAVLAGQANVRPDEEQLVEVTVTADTASAGPGDLTVAIWFEPRVR